MAMDAIPMNLLSFSSYYTWMDIERVETNLGISEDFLPWPCDRPVAYLRVICDGRVVQRY